MKTIYYYIGGGVLLVLIGYGFGRYVQPAKVVVKTNTVTQTNDVIHDHIVTVTVTKTLPNGEKDTQTTTTNNTVINDKSTTSTQSSTVTTYNKPQWKINAMAGLGTANLAQPIYGAQLERRIIGPIFAGAWGNSNREGGISLGLEF